MKYVLCWIINKLRTFNYILSQLLNTLKRITFNLCSFNINMLSLVVLHPERNRRRLRDSRQSDHDNFAVPERSENVWISLGEADGLYGQLEGEGGDQVDGVEVPHTQVAVLVSVQKVVVAGQQTWVSHDKWKSILNTRRGDEHQNRERGIRLHTEKKRAGIYVLQARISVILMTIETVGSLTGLSKTKTMRVAGITC